MYKFFVILFIYILFINLPKAKGENKEDKLSGFVECDGKFPNTITHFTFNPNPVKKNETTKFEIGGVSKVAFDRGSHLGIILFYKGFLVKYHAQDFCEQWVEPSGEPCPVGPGEFHFKGSKYFIQTKDDPTDVTLTGYVRLFIASYEGHVRSCIEGNVSVTYL
ncbi:phosphatidylglycerol/phosphatidylinositol transfer protein [Gigaspora margarita]|uniref:Phosphatidylglycerol/phosphatidylinositol transfer protein n=1 Tax=Gigaspora margarita TaxID=4874 RepID=A0A8H4AE06_GIGMA|nr:phosphatidylglycerol/phosphatidylinositol transfer protein [Gigaspora margarita]